MYRFLLSPRWLGFAVFVIALGGMCVQFGLWQWHKVDSRQDENALVEKHLAADPVPLDAVVPRGEKPTDDIEWTRVTARGTFDRDDLVTVKFVSRDGVPGIDVVAPLVLDDGTALLVDLGFLESPRTNTRPENLPAPPTGEVTIEGWLRPDNGAGSSATKVSNGQVRAISSTGLADHYPYELRSGFVNLQDPGVEGLIAEPRPDLGAGPHFFYALQWWFFGLLAFLGYFWFAHAEAHPRTPQARRTQARETRSV